MRARSHIVLLGFTAFVALYAPACTSILGDFSVAECPPGQSLVSGVCAPGGADGDGGGGGEGGTVATCAEPGAPQCGAHGTCADVSGVAVCTCEAGYEGTTCTTCSAGYEAAGDGTCEAKCETECPSHGFCVVENGQGKCACAPGYALEGTTCTWTGGPLDPTLEGNPASVWQAVGGTIVPDAPGRSANEKGVFIVPREVVCGAAPVNASLTQTIAMPQVKDGEPFALKLVGRSHCEGPGGAALGNCYGDIAVETTLGYPGTVTTIPKSWSEHQICLGDKAYGGQVNVGIHRLAPVGHPGFCYQHTDGERRELQIDSIGIVPSTECPAVGTVANGDFEGDGIWKTTSGSGATASVDPGIGDKSSRAARLTSTNGCSTAWLESKISIPSASIPNAELTFKFKGPQERSLAVGFGEVAPRLTVRGNGTYQSVSVCLPNYGKGYVIPFDLSMASESGCPTTPSREMIVDELKIGSAPERCPADVFIQDSGFENTAVAHWELGSSAGPPVRSTAAITTGPTPHSGARMVSLSGYQTCYEATARTVITVPPPNGAAGPVVKFFSRIRNATAAAAGVTYAVATSDANTQVTTTSFNTWQAGKLCLPPTAAGSSRPLTLSLRSPVSPCGTTISPTATIDFDDVTVGTDPDCPAD